MVARLIEEARAAVPDILVEEVDITQYPEVAVKYRVMAPPAIAINSRLEFVGVPQEDALRARPQAAGPGWGGWPRTPR